MEEKKIEYILKITGYGYYNSYKEQIVEVSRDTLSSARKVHTSIKKLFEEKDDEELKSSSYGEQRRVEDIMRRVSDITDSNWDDYKDLQDGIVKRTTSIKERLL